MRRNVSDEVSLARRSNNSSAESGSGESASRAGRAPAREADTLRETRPRFWRAVSGSRNWATSIRGIFEVPECSEDGIKMGGGRRGSPAGWVDQHSMAARQSSRFPVLGSRFTWLAAHRSLRCWQSPSPGAKVFANSDGVIAAPGAIGSEISRAKISVPGTETVEKKVLGYAHFKSLA